MSESELKNCKPQSARLLDRIRIKMKGARKLSWKRSGASDKQGLLVCFKTGPCSQNCTILLSNAQMSLEHTEVPNSTVPNKMHV